MERRRHQLRRVLADLLEAHATKPVHLSALANVICVTVYCVNKFYAEEHEKPPHPRGLNSLPARAQAQERWAGGSWAAWGARQVQKWSRQRQQTPQRPPARARYRAPPSRRLGWPEPPRALPLRQQQRAGYRTRPPARPQAPETARGSL